MMRVPFMFISYEWVARNCQRARAIARMLLGTYPSVRYDLKALNVSVEPEYFALAAFLSASIIGIFFFLLGLVMLTYRQSPDRWLSAVVGFMMFLMFYILFMFYPGIRLKQVTTKTDNELIFALRDLQMQVASGVSLYDAMISVANSNYGYVSQDFSVVVRKISTGTPEVVALQELSLETKSVYLQKAMWQLITSINAGSSLATALKTIIASLEYEQFVNLRKYTSQLNFIVMIYMLVAAAVPSIGITFLVLLSAFSGSAVGEGTIVFAMGLSVLLQIIIIGYLKSTRPSLSGG